MAEQTSSVPLTGLPGPGPGSGGSGGVNPGVNPGAMTLEEVARLLSSAGGRRITPEQIQADIEAGAPVGPAPGGRINLVHYTAWLLREYQAQ